MSVFVHVCLAVCVRTYVCVFVYFTMNHAILICPVKQLPSAAADRLQACKSLMQLLSGWI